MVKWVVLQGKELITAEYVHHLFNLGTQCESKDVLYELLTQHYQCDSVANALFGGYYKASGKWNTDFTTDVKTWTRIGNVQYDELGNDFCSSFNHADQVKEKGVSVMDSDWLNTVSAHFFDQSKGIYEVQGIQVAWGSDGEPLIVPTSIPTLTSKEAN